MKPFRFWVQTALPQVYDDSLSYYELLCKVVSYINSFMSDVQQFGEIVAEYTEKVDEIQKYVDGYFESTDFQNLVDARLDQMAQDGEFDDIITPIINSAMQDVQDALTNVENVTNSFDDRVEALETVTGEQGLAITNLRTDLGDVEDDVEQLMEESGGRNAEWKLVFVKGSAIGDCFYMCSEGKAVVFDAGNDATATDLIASLTGNQVTQIVAIVVSHWHADHVNGLSGLLASSAFDFTGCVMYKPHRNIEYNRCTGDWVSYVPERDTQYTSSIANKGGSAVYPDEGQRVEVEGLTLEFSNLASAKFNNYYDAMLNENGVNSGHTQYNNFSMMAAVYFGGVKLAFSGDAMPEAEAENRGFPDGAQLYKVEHHGLNRKTDAVYANAIGSTLAVVTDYGGAHSEAMRVKTPTVNRCIGLGALYDTVEGNVEFIVSKYGVVMGNDAIAVNSPLYHGELGGGNLVANGTDFNTLTAPGIYSVQDATGLATMLNAPNANAGGKLIVETIATNGYVNQTFVQSNSYTPAVWSRCRAWDSVNSVYVWRAWRCLRPSYYFEEGLSQYYQVAVQPGGTRRENRIIIQNGVLTMCFRFTTTGNIPTSQSFVELPIALETPTHTHFSMFDDNGNVYHAICGNYDGKLGCWVLNNTLVEGLSMYGSVTIGFNTNFPE